MIKKKNNNNPNTQLKDVLLIYIILTVDSFPSYM